MTKPLNFLCFGAGAIGTYLGGSLALAGCNVVFLERPEAAEVIRSSGIKIRTADGEGYIPEPKLVNDLGKALSETSFDVCILAVKAFDTPSLLRDVEPYHKALPPIICFQNGVENEKLLSEFLGEERVIPGTVTSAVGKNGPGDIFLQKLRGVGLSSHHPLVPEIIQWMNTAGLQAAYIESAEGMKWSKMFTNLISNALSAILDMTPGEIFSHTGLYKLELEQLRETLKVMQALNIPVVNLPGTPVKLLAGVLKYLPADLSRPLVTQSVGKGRGEKMPSFHIDLHMGRGKSEVDYLNGAVVRFGKKTGIPTPANRFLNRILSDLVDQKLALDTFAKKPETLLKAYVDFVSIE